jgi:hypothetical protein
METIGFKSPEQGIRHSNSVIPPIDYQHALCIGATGSGKTASFILPTIQDRIARGHTVIFFDHKGHEHAKIKHLALQAGRLHDVVEIGKPHGMHINLLSELDIIRVKDLIRSIGHLNDAYWTNSAANMVEDIIAPWRNLYDIYKLCRNDTRFESIRQFCTIKDIDLSRPVSFKMLTQYTRSAKIFTEYQALMIKTADNLLGFLDYALANYPVEEHSRRHLMGKVLELREQAETLERISIDAKGNDVNSGNNAVLQILDNNVATYAKKGYLNDGNRTLAELFDQNAIVIIDSQSFDTMVLKLLFESMLKKTVMRLRNGRNKPISIFIDEANRVLSSSFDLHSDVLREAKAELIIAIQNEEQMIEKFGVNNWEAVRKNIKHIYHIDLQHRLAYNNGSYISQTPMLIDETEQVKSEWEFFALDANRERIEKYFLGNSDHLPDRFIVDYDPETFELSSSILLQASDGSRFKYHYFGEDMIAKIDKRLDKNRKRLHPSSPRHKRSFEEGLFTV